MNTAINFLAEKILGIFFKLFFLIFGEPRISRNLQKAIDLYSHEGFASLFAKIRAWDAPYDEVEKLVPEKGTILDLGSGDGLMANFLALSAKKRKLYGIEFNQMRVGESDRGLANTVFMKGDIVRKDYPKADIVLLIHVLHHLRSFELQEKVLAKISKLLSKNKKLIILEIDSKPIGKYLFSFFTDAVIVPILFEKRLFSLDFHYRKMADWKTLLKKHGFTVRKAKRSNSGMPFSHILLEAIKK